jgi:tetratricopeptide (TPR) repeat protein
MKQKLYLIIIIASIFTGCGGTKNLGVYRDQAEAAESQSNYAEAVKQWNLYFSETAREEIDIDGITYARAAKTAFRAGMDNQSADWFDQARYRNYADKEMYFMLAEIFRKQNNFSKELSALEYYFENFDKNNTDINLRLFSLYHEINETEKVLNIWPLLSPEDQKTEKNLDIFFELNKLLNNEQICDSISLELLKIAPGHTGALEWNATKFYRKAENHYQAEVEKYENNRTRRQYRILLDELKQVTADFKTALNYFEKLWEQNRDVKYAGYLANIYTRLNDKEKAEYFRKFAE